jgi:phospholipase C
MTSCRLLGNSMLLFVILGVVVVTEAQDRIKHVVVLMQENRPFDHLFGWMKGVDGLSGDEFNLVDPNDPNSLKVFVDDKAPFLNDCDPCHATPCTTKKLFATQSSKTSGIADMGGFVSYQNASAAKNYCNVMSGFPPSKVPILTSLAQEYGIMDRFFASHPGPTWPNRMFALTATSAGSTETSVWYHDKPGQLYPQKTFYDQVEESGLTWKNYFNDTPWELILEKVAHSPHNLHPLDQFYQDAESGDLPAFSWINPRSGMNVTTGVGSNDQHPDHDMSAGEQYYKDIYEAIRASPAWEETLFIITYDEHGGFYDHVVPPSRGIPPPGDGEKSYPDKFEFDRLGVRIPTLLISPWIKKGTVISEPPDNAKPADNSEYELTSIMASVRKLLNMKTGPLTQRDAWSATFDHELYVLDQPRTDCPMHLPEALAPELPDQSLEAEQDKEVNDLQLDIATVLHHLGGIDHLQRFPQLQGELSEWLVRQYNNHKEETKKWLSSKSLEHADVVAKVKSKYIGPYEDPNWDLNGLPYGSTDNTYINSTAPYITLSTHNLRHSILGTHSQKKAPYCLDAGDGVAGSTITASVCYPSPNPDTNRDAMQHWVLHNDGTLRLFNPNGPDTLCVTNSVFKDYYRRGLRGEEIEADSQYTIEQQKVTLETCDDDVNQTFAYHGIAPGYTGNGNLEFGDVEFYLGVVQHVL